MLHGRLPAICDFSVTNVCDAACDFCGFASDKRLSGPARYADAEAFARALSILYRRRIRYLTLQGGEPLVHPDIVRLVSDTTATGISCAVITNGWFLPRYMEAMAAVGLSRLIGYDELPATLLRLGFDCVSFSYPRREPFGSTSLVYGESHLVDLDRDELLAALDAIGRLRKRFPVLNPRASLAEVARFVRGEPQAVRCIGGHKYFYLDWNLDIWRCEAWSEPLGSVFDLDRIPDQREACNACMMACYRNASMLMHAAVAATDAARSLAAGQIGAAVSSLFRRSVAQSLCALIEETPQMRRLARWRKQTVTAGHVEAG